MLNVNFRFFPLWKKNNGKNQWEKSIRKIIWKNQGEKLLQPGAEGAGRKFWVYRHMTLNISGSGGTHRTVSPTDAKMFGIHVAKAVQTTKKIKRIQDCKGPTLSDFFSRLFCLVRAATLFLGKESKKVGTSRKESGPILL